jgi:hypothetical protein
MPLTVRKFISVEMIRDGGSFAAEFESADGNRYILFTKIRLVDCGPAKKDERGYLQENELVGYHPPVIIDCDSAKRPPDTDTVKYSDMSGPKSPITWDQARNIIGEVAKLAQSLGPVQADCLRQMVAVIQGDGHPPRGSKKRSTWSRPSRPAHRCN